MHGYSIDSDERERVPLLVAVAALLLSYSIWLALQQFAIELPWWLSAPSVIGIYGGLSALFNQWLWRRPVVRRLLSLRTPNVAGVWTGTVTPAADGLEPKQITVTIRQTWSKIGIGLESTDSQSRSMMGGVTTETPGRPEIIYEYLNEPKPGAADGMHAHRGLARLSIHAGLKELEGEYFTGRDRVTHGTIRLTRPDI
jgi:hypothetical protein